VANFYGTDLARYINADGVIDISPSLAQAGGTDVLIQSLVSRQMCVRGSIIDAPNEGIDLRTYLKNGMTQQDLANLPSLVQKELQRDERVLSVLVTGQYDTTTQTLTLIEKIVPVNGGPFTLTLAVTSLTVALINGSP
jgi:hypothetical protein